jgi:hypothetical protein
MVEEARNVGAEPSRTPSQQQQTKMQRCNLLRAEDLLGESSNVARGDRACYSTCNEPRRASSVEDRARRRRRAGSRIVGFGHNAHGQLGAGTPTSPSAAVPPNTAKPRPASSPAAHLGCGPRTRTCRARTSLEVTERAIPRAMNPDATRRGNANLAVGGGSSQHRQAAAGVVTRDGAQNHAARGDRACYSTCNEPRRASSVEDRARRRRRAGPRPTRTVNSARERQPRRRRRFLPTPPSRGRRRHSRWVKVPSCPSDGVGAPSCPPLGDSRPRLPCSFQPQPSDEHRSRERHELDLRAGPLD